MSSTMPLRERKKHATKLALANAALELADTNGLAQLRIEDIADRAGVSMRTFRNYFSSKEAALVWLLTHNYDLVVDALEKDRADKDLFHALAEACATLYPTDPDRDWVKRMRMLKTEPALAAERYRGDAMALETLADQIAEWAKARHDATIYPHFAAEVTQAALRAAIDYWLDEPDTPPLRKVVRDFISRIRIS